MAALSDVEGIVSALPEVTEGERFGDVEPPAGPILAVRTADLADKEAVLATRTRGFFTIPHFDGYAAILVTLRSVAKKPLREAIEDAWLACAPEKLSRAFLDGSSPLRSAAPRRSR